MRRTGNRTIKVDKKKLIKKIKENKDEHIKEYQRAVKAYKKEALSQLEKLKSYIESDILDIRLDLITPVNNSENYDKIIEMFEWEVESKVELEQSEFREYVQDETDFAITAKVSNTAYFTT